MLATKIRIANVKDQPVKSKIDFRGYTTIK